MHGHRVAGDIDNPGQRLAAFAVKNAQGIPGAQAAGFGDMPRRLFFQFDAPTGEQRLCGEKTRAAHGLPGYRPRFLQICSVGWAWFMVKKWIPGAPFSISV